MLRKVEFIGSGYEVVKFVMVDTDTMAEAIEAAKKWYEETGQDFHYVGMEIPKEYAYDESIDKPVGGSVKLSVKAQELLDFLREEYKDNGYLYSGSWPYNSLTERGFGKEVIHELLKEGKIQRRDCDDYAFELSPVERGALISSHNLDSVWFEKAGRVFLPEIQQEVQNAGVVDYSVKCVDELVSNATIKARDVNSGKGEKVLSFVDDIGFTQFSVDAVWYEKQENKDDVVGLFQKASFDDESGLKDLTGKYLEPEMGM